MTSRRWRSFVAVSIRGVLALLLGLTPLGVDAQPGQSGSWVTAWSTSQHALGRAAISNATVRLMAQVAIPGESVRVRLDNTLGTAPLTIGKAQVALRLRGAMLAPMTTRPLAFGGAATVTIPPGGTVTSDAVPMKVVARQDLAVSLHLPGADVRPSEHGMALTTSYVTAAGAGDVTGEEAAAKFTTPITTMPWLKSVDVLTASNTAAAVVTFGDSITDGFCSTVDGTDTWGEWLGLRMDLEGKRQIAFLNEGINGNTLTAFPTGAGSTPGIERLDRDVLSHSGVTHVVLFIGTNDIRRGPPAAQVISGMENVIQRVKARGIRIYGVTVIPRHISAGAAGNPGWTAEANKVRDEVNTWIRNKGQFDAVIDFDKVVRDPASPERIAAAFDCDGIHLSPRGYYEAARSIRLDLFDRPKARR